ncbi:MAG: (deoxy)nucleoside triphosphate pyrophosphohydrolase [Clostridia bacterium]|nr:(deoxy)nucleoside triphosphate pyrophosphohydrolase [Clostridia bacterium]
MTQVVAALIWEQNKFMICQRPANKTRAFEWEFVGGKVEKNETLQQALVRECREEIGVDIEVGSVFMEVDHVYPDITIHLTLFNASLNGKTPKKLEHNDIRFILPSEIPLYEFCPADKEILKKIIRDSDKAD